MKDTRISTRLAAGFGFMALLIGLIAGTALLKLQRVESAFDLVIEDRYDKIARLNDVKVNVNLIARALLDVLLATDPAEIQRGTEQVRAARARISDVVKALDPQITTEEGRRQMAALLAARSRFITLQDQMLQAAASQRDQDPRKMMATRVRPAQDEYFGRLDALIAFQQRLMKQAATDANGQIAGLRNVILGASALGLAAAVLLAWWIVRSIAAPLKRAVGVTRAVAAGDLSVEIATDAGRNEMGELQASLRDMQGSLARVVADVRRNAEQVATASTQIAQGNGDLSARTEEQASALQETAASMKQLASTVQQNAENAREGNALAVNASAVAVRGGEAVDRVVRRHHAGRGAGDPQRERPDGRDQRRQHRAERRRRAGRRGGAPDGPRDPAERGAGGGKRRGGRQPAGAGAPAGGRGCRVQDVGQRSATAGGPAAGYASRGASGERTHVAPRRLAARQPAPGTPRAVAAHRHGRRRVADVLIPE
nr:MCP four helix bundle domain-containing protein [Ramlibacter alkalitolerans]